MKYKLERLKNGLRLVSIPLPDLESVNVTVWADVGSRYEVDKNAGISHFFEHMVFKGSKKRPSSDEISHTLDAIGAEFNASTAQEYTNYYIKARKGVLEKAMDVLSDMVLNPLLKEGDIEKESDVIVEEISMHDDMPIEKVSNNFNNLIFENHPLGRDIAGTKTSVKSIGRKDFVKFRDKQYSARNMVITIAGSAETKTSKKLAEKYFGKLEKGSKTKPRKYKDRQTSIRIHLENKKTEQAHLVLGYRAYPRDSKDRFALMVLSTILGRGMSSRLFREVRERRGLAYAVVTSVSQYIDTGVIATYAGVGIDKIEKAIEVILEQHRGIASLAENKNDEKYKVTDGELKKAKEFIKGRMALSLENTTNINDLFGKEVLFLDKVKTPSEIFKAIDDVGLDDVYRVAGELFVPEKLNLAVVGPYNKKDRLENLLKKNGTR